jgi:tripartite-type tricarboxylate transporter receptor subunit TctC
MVRSARARNPKGESWASRMNFAIAAIAASALLQPTGILAQQQSVRPMTLVVPFSSGTGPDILARLIGEEFQKRRGLAVVVDNKPGASGAIGAQLAARAAPDGQTLMIVPDPPFTANVGLIKALRYHPQTDFAPVIELAVGSVVLAVHASIPAKSTQEFIVHVRERPGKLNYGSSGIGTTHHLSMEVFKQAASIDIAHVPFKDAAGMLSSLLGGHVSAGFLPLHQALPLPRDKIRLLAIASKDRIAASSDLPTFGELGFIGMEAGFRLGMLAPAATPRELIDAHNHAVNEILQAPHVVEKLAVIGLTPVGGTPERYARALASDLQKWQKAFRNAGISAK